MRLECKLPDEGNTLKHLHCRLKEGIVKWSNLTEEMKLQRVRVVESGNTTKTKRGTTVCASAKTYPTHREKTIRFVTLWSNISRCE